MENNKNNKKNFRGKFKFSLCKWLRFNNKIYSKTVNEKDEEDNDWDNGNLINGNKPILVTRRSGIL